jgi:hypothetical protein
MKKILAIATVTITCLGVWTGCNENLLDIKPPSPIEPTYYNTEKQMDNGVIGIYSKLVFFYNFRGYDGNNYLHDLRLMEDDDLTTLNPQTYDVFTLMTPNDYKNNVYFKYLYEVNSRANNLLEVHATKADEVYANADLKNTHKGEMLFLRGYSSWMLWNFYGTAPLILKRYLPGDDLYATNSEGNELLNSAIDDFKAAAELLPASWDSFSKGRATKGSALGMAGKALVFRATVTKNSADYTAALALFNQISGYSLVPNYADNFSFRKENNSESLFEVQLGPNTNLPETSNPWLKTDEFAGNGDISNTYIFFSPHWSNGNGGSQMVATNSLVNAFPANDPRRDSSIMLTEGGTKWTVVKLIRECPKNNGVPYKGDLNFEVSYSANARILRLADVKLLQAEALIQSGGSTADAIALINEVRKRARGVTNNPTPLDRNVAEANRDEIMRWIVEERRLELAFEEGTRWFDLRRWHMGDVLTKLYGKDLKTWDFSTKTASKFEEKNLYKPIPQPQIQLNPNLNQHHLWVTTN